MNDRNESGSQSRKESDRGSQNKQHQENSDHRGNEKPEQRDENTHKESNPKQRRKETPKRSSRANSREEVIVIESDEENQPERQPSSSFLEEEPVIIEHISRENTIKFRLCWVDYNIKTWKSAEETSTKYENTLRTYLKKLSVKSPTKLYNIMEKHPSLAKMMRKQ